MSEVPLEELVAAATAYENLFVPSLFHQWAPRIVAAAGIQPGQRVLDVACGTGILAREAGAHVGSSGRVCGVDPAPGMLAVAERIAPDIEWREGAAEALPFPDASFDVVVSQFGLMFFPDRTRALREMLRVLTPGGRLAVAVWDTLENIPAVGIEVRLLERIAGTEAADALRAPFALGDPHALKQLAADAGVASPEVSTQHGTARFPSIRSLVEADLRGWLPVMDVFLPDEQIERILDAAEGELRDFVGDDGGLVFDTPAHILTGTKAQA